MAACSRCKGQAERSRAPLGFISLRLHSSVRNADAEAECSRELDHLCARIRPGEVGDRCELSEVAVDGRDHAAVGKELEHDSLGGHPEQVDEPDRGVGRIGRSQEES